MHYHFSSYEEQKDPRIILFCKNIISTLKDVGVFNIACDIKNFIRDSQYDEKNTSTTNDKFVWYYTLESYPDVYLSYQHYIVSDNWEVYTENIVFDKEKKFDNSPRTLHEVFVNIFTLPIKYIIKKNLKFKKSLKNVVDEHIYVYSAHQ